MLKSIPKSNISRRSFKVYKKFTASQSDYPVIKAFTEDGLFDSETFTKATGISEDVFVHLLYKSIEKKYYTDNGLLNNYGDFANDANFESERELGTNMYVIKISQSKFGEKIKPGTVRITDTDTTEVYGDSGKGRIVSTNPSYTIVSADFQLGELVLSIDSTNFTFTITSIDFETGAAILTFGSDTDTEFLTSFDLESNTAVFVAELQIGGSTISQNDFGNIFYSDGAIVFTGLSSDLNNYNIEYRATQTIHETEVLIEAKAGEFNYSQNPSAIDITVSGSFDFETTPITNVSSAKTVKIKHYRDIKRKASYSGSFGSTTGSWDDYDNKFLSDPTGSYLTTYVSTIGIYDKDGDMVAVAKLPKPFKKLPDYDTNFIIRFDT